MEISQDTDLVVEALQTAGSQEAKEGGGCD
jgi:hypothetical protein